LEAREGMFRAPQGWQDKEYTMALRVKYWERKDKFIFDLYQRTYSFIHQVRESVHAFDNFFEILVFPVFQPFQI
jgi:hypothetical protein